MKLYPVDGNNDACVTHPMARTWQSGETAPKDRVILADLGWPWPLATLWDAESEKWACAYLTCESINAGKHSLNVGWETEYEPTVKRWMEMPAL